jgi:serine/threonine-protein kinase
LAVLRKITESRPRPIHQINESLPAWFDLLVSKLMAIDPAQRIATAEEAADLLRDAHAHVRHPAANSLPESLLSHRIDKRTALAALGATMLVPLAFLATSPLWPDTVVSTDKLVSDQRAGTTVTDPIASLQPDSTSVAELHWSDSPIELELFSIQQSLNLLQHSLSESLEPLVTSSENPSQ